MGDKFLNWLLKKLADLYGKQFYGSVELTFEKGRVVHVKTITSEKPPLDT